MERRSRFCRPNRFKLASRRESMLQEQCRLNVDFPPTGADITKDRKRLAVITDDGAYLFEFQRGRIPSSGQVEPSLLCRSAKQAWRAAPLRPKAFWSRRKRGKFICSRTRCFG